MSIYVMAPVLRCHIPDVAQHTDGSKGCDGSTMKLVLLGLADSANEDGTGAHPGVRDLALFAQCHTATVVRALRTLTALGAIRLADPGGPGRCATYDVVMEWVTAGVADRHRRAIPLRAPGAQGPERAPQARDTRAPEARKARAPEARSYAPPVVTSCGADAADVPSRWPEDDAGTVPGWAQDRWPHLRVNVDPAVPPDATWEDGTYG